MLAIHQIDLHQIAAQDTISETRQITQEVLNQSCQPTQARLLEEHYNLSNKLNSSQPSHLLSSKK